MKRQPSSARLHRKATLAGYGVAAAAGALTVGLIAGVSHPAATASGALASTTGTTSISGTMSTPGVVSHPNGGIGAAPQGTTAVGGSHGS